MRKFLVSIRFHLTWLVLLGVLPAFGLALYSRYQLREAEMINAEADSYYLTRMMVDRQQSWADGVENLLSAVSVLPELRSSTEGVCEDVLADMLTRSPSFINIGVVDLNGDITCSGIPLSAPVNIADRGYFERAISTQGLSVGEHQIGRVTGRSSLNFGYPMFYPNGEVEGIVYAAMGLEKANQMLMDLEAPHDSEMMWVDGNGTVLARNVDPDRWVGDQLPAQMLAVINDGDENKPITMRGFDGIERLYTFSTVESEGFGGLTVVTGLPTQQIFAASRYSTVVNMSGLAIVALLALGTAWIFGELAFTRRLLRLLEVARRISAGDLSARSDLKVGKSEVSQLVVAVDAMAENLEERARINEERSRLLDASRDAILLRDRNGTVKTWNKGAEALFGYSEEEAVGAYLPDLLRTEYPHSIDDIEWQVLTEKHWEGELSHISKVGKQVWVNSRWTSLIDHNGRVYAILESHTDISTQKQAQRDRIAREVAEQANRAKSDFLSRMSHELRTPLNAILGFGQLLEMDGLADKQNRSVDQILKSGTHLLGLINEVLDISRIESGRLSLSLEPIRVEDAIREAFALITPLAEARGIKLSMKLPSSSDIFVKADRQRLKQVLLNLLSNAVKYNRPAGKIHVEGSLTVSGFLRLDVHDSGEGIPAVKMARLFQPFDRLDRMEPTEEGTGLGLVLSKGLLEAMNGRIWAESVVGEGTIMRIELPLVTKQLKEDLMAEVDEHLSQGAKTKGGVVLYVEDNLANIQLVEAIFSRMPVVRLMTTMQGQTAKDLARDHLPDLILLDVHLPDINGAEVLKWLKSRSDTRQIPVVVISADVMPTQIETLMSLGSRKYLTKPIVVKEFLDVMNEVLV